MKELDRLNKLIGKIRNLADSLENLRQLKVHQEINQFYYMQKASELELLHDQLNELLQKEEGIRNLIQHVYSETYHNWKRDARWLSKNHNRKLRHIIL